MQGKWSKQSYLGAVPGLPAPEPIKEIMVIDTNTRQHHKWFELMKLVHRCPSTVNGITIMGSPHGLLSGAWLVTQTAKQPRPTSLMATTRAVDMAKAGRDRREEISRRSTKRELRVA
jgi:hypothetical protein